MGRINKEKGLDFFPKLTLYGSQILLKKKKMNEKQNPRGK